MAEKRNVKVKLVEPDVNKSLSTIIEALQNEIQKSIQDQSNILKQNLSEDIMNEVEKFESQVTELTNMLKNYVISTIEEKIDNYVNSLIS
ncbi:ORF MSV264 89 amino acid repeat gene family protein [Melanoplus sanguinipes entomopoxvirus]|uniref:ORF MSV002 89 amino acid repeat gene family protein n=1 Tax=Melanoplus sanguinipes entomopoxvirus TaxID=83191 RepID=Q9YJ47_MSEPV|nr:ORF MSV002 89 amino acid repeat gene family protein [Melanoplus sanguinipes entomopoxvirus]NP_048335.1 ORF MSV264 89 amino acid repeat gene family protein [Melanoplus sanguinipes entomopoxvirus]AAC97862.1 ORF MSV264 89 amino acid repeat gene family protein [Melanoplus sanguinipes entomopoxvirus 'O']AAC97867.1 ORF MSV002 89 amino acid repeat gene family protein [Melanoplus sanguinipes entomopoxvirus 'O']